MQASASSRVCATFVPPRGILRAVLVGRERELARLSDRLRHRQPVVVVGEAGVGKTTLLRAAAAASGRAVLEGGALATLRWMEHLPLRRALRRPVRGADALGVADDVAGEVGGGVLVLDDLQWSDPATVEAVALLPGRVTVVAGVRGGDPGAQPVLDRLGGAGFEQLDIAPLDAVSSAELVRCLRPDLAEPAVDRHVRRTGGNPLLLRELAATGEPSSSLRLALAARLRLLDVEGRDAFGMLALAGRPLAVGDLGPVGAKSLVGADLVVVHGSEVAPRHALLAETAVELLEPEDRRRLHARLARVAGEPGEAARHHALAGETGLAHRHALGAAHAAARPGERAGHLRLAAECATGQEADALRLEAALALDAALDWPGVVAVLEQLKAPDDRVRAWSALLRARAAWVGGGAEAVRSALVEGLSLAAGTGTEIEVRLRVEETRLPLFVDCDFDGGVRMATAALELARTAGVDVARAEYFLGSALGLKGAGGWEEHLRAAVGGAREAGDTQTEFLAANNLISLHESIGAPVEGRRVALDMIARARDLGLGFWERGLRVMALNLDLHAGAYDRVLSDADALLDQPLDARDRDTVTEALCVALIDVGRIDEALHRVAAAQHRFLGDYRGNRQLALVSAEAALWGGQSERALEVADEAFTSGEADHNRVLGRVTRAWACVELGRDPGEAVEAQTWPLLFAAPLETAGLRLLHLGDHQAAADQFEQAAELWAPYHRRGEIRCRWAAGEARRRAGDLAGAVECLEAVEKSAEALGLGPLLVRIRRSLRAAGRRRSAPRSQGHAGLTGREADVLRLVAGGLTNAEIAARLGVSRSTVAAQVASACAKLGAANRAQAASLLDRR